MIHVKHALGLSAGVLLFTAVAQASTVAVFCPLTARLDVVDEAGLRQRIDLERLTASYSGEGAWGPRWWCDYGLKAGREFVRAQLISGEPTLGTRIQLLRSATSRYLSISLNRTRLRPGAGLDAVNNYNHDPVKVLSARWTWDPASRTASDPMGRDEYAFVTYSTAPIAGECRPDLARALQPDSVRFVVWSASRNREWFEALPGAVQVDRRTGDRYKAGTATRCTETRRATDGRTAVRCEMTYDLANSRWLSWSEAEARRDCVYQAGSSLPPALVEATPDATAPALAVSGAAADFAAAAGRGPCVRKPGSGLDSRCDFPVNLE